MPQGPDWKQFLEAGMQFTAMTRAQAQRRARELVREGQLAQERMQSFVEELLETSRQRAEEFTDIVRKEVARQLRAMGISAGGARKATKKKAAGKKKAAKKKASTKKKAPAKKKATAKKSTKKSTKKKAAGAKKSSSGQGGSNNSAAKKSP
jgi:histone H1/5